MNYYLYVFIIVFKLHKDANSTKCGMVPGMVSHTTNFSKFLLHFFFMCTKEAADGAGAVELSS